MKYYILWFNVFVQNRGSIIDHIMRKIKNMINVCHKMLEVRDKINWGLDRTIHFISSGFC